MTKTMTLNLSLGFQDLADDNGRKYVPNLSLNCPPLIRCRYSLQLADTIKVGANNSTLVTDGTKAVGDTLFFLTRDDNVKAKKEKKAPVVPRGNGVAPKLAGGKQLRGGSRRNDEVQASALARFREHQHTLREKLLQEGLAKYNEEGVPTTGSEGKGWKKFQSYKGEGALPSNIERCKACFYPLSSGLKYRTNVPQIVVDRKAQTVVLPIHGFAVPFHINTIKNASKNDEGVFTYLRVNFQTPGQAGAARKEDQVCPICLPHGLL